MEDLNENMNFHDPRGVEGKEYPQLDQSDQFDSVREEDDYESESEPHAKDIYFGRTFKWLLGAIVFLVPLFFLPWTSDILEFQKQVLLIALVGLGLVLWLVSVIQKGKLQFIPTKLGFPIAMLIVVLFLSSIFSVESFRSFFGTGGAVGSSFTTWLTLALFFFLSISIFKDRGNYLIRAILVSSIVALLFATLQVLGIFIIPFSFLKLKAFTTLGSLNSIGILAAALLPLFIGTVYANERFWEWLRYVGITLAIFVLILVNWWVLWTVAIVGMVALVAIRSFDRGFKPSRFVLPMTVIVVGIFLIITNLNLGFLKQGLPTEIAPSYGLSYEVTKSALLEKPVLGYGPEGFVFAYDKFGSPSLAGTVFSNLRFQDATSEFFTFVTQTGFLGLAAFVFFIFSIVSLIVKSFWNKHEQEIWGADNSNMAPVGASIFAFIAAFLLYPFNIPILFLFWAMLSVLVLTVENSKRINVLLDDSPRYSLISSVAFILGLVLVLSGFYYTTIRYIADVKFAKARISQDTDNSLALVVDAINTNPNDSRYYRLASNVILLKISEEINKQDDDPNRSARIQNLVQGVFDVSKRATDRNPHDSANWNQRGVVYQSLIGVVGGVEDLAIQYYQEALQRSPSNPSVLNRIGEIYLSQSDSKSRLAQNQKNTAERNKLLKESDEALTNAQENFQRAVGLNRNFGIALYNLGATYDRQGKVKDAIIQLERIAPFNANNPGLAFELGLLYYRDNKKDASFIQMQRAVQLSSNYSNALWYLALIHEERGELNRAIARLKKILETNTGNQVVIQKIADLEVGITTIPPEKVTDQEPLQP